MKVGSKRITGAAAATMIVGLIGIGFAASGSNFSLSPLTGSFKRGNETSPMKGDVTSVPSIRALALQATQPAGPKRMMVEDVFTNVQALKAMPVDDFMGTMGLMAASLGFCCNDCHTGAGTDQVKWEEDNAKKKTARQMVFMVQAINKQNFGGRNVVTCWTCHRGRDLPVTTPRLDQVYSEPVVELDDLLVKAPGVPTPDELLDKYLAAIGGAQKVAAIKSYSAKGKSVGFGGFGGGGQVEIFGQAPDKRAVYIHFPDDPERGDSTRTFNGQAGWIATPLAVVRKYPLSGGEFDGARLDAQLAFPAQIKQTLTNLRVGPPTEVLGKSVDVLQGNGPRGTLVNLYFDRDTNLLTRTVRYAPSAIGRVPTQVDYDKYSDVNGVKLPHMITFVWLDGRDSIELTDIQTNVQVDAAKFGEPTPLPTPKR